MKGSHGSSSFYSFWLGDAALPDAAHMRDARRKPLSIFNKVKNKNRVKTTAPRGRSRRGADRARMKRRPPRSERD